MTDADNHPYRRATDMVTAAPASPPPGGNIPFTWGDMDKHMDSKLEPIHEKLDKLLKLMESTVPDGDFDAHRKAHEHWITEVETRKAFWTDVFKDTMKWVVRSALLALALGLMLLLKDHLK
jgi:hypothetical protein